MMWRTPDITRLPHYQLPTSLIFILRHNIPQTPHHRSLLCQTGFAFPTPHHSDQILLHSLVPSWHSPFPSLYVENQLAVLAVELGLCSVTSWHPSLHLFYVTHLQNTLDKSITSLTIINIFIARCHFQISLKIISRCCTLRYCTNQYFQVWSSFMWLSFS